MARTAAHYREHPALPASDAGADSGADAGRPRRASADRVAARGVDRHDYQHGGTHEHSAADRHDDTANRATIGERDGAPGILDTRGACPAYCCAVGGAALDDRHAKAITVLNREF